MEVLQGLYLLSALALYWSHAHPLHCNADTSGAVVPDWCNTCYDVIGQRCLRNMEVIQDDCREGICVYMQGKYVLRTRENYDMNGGTDGQCVDKDPSWCHMKHRLGYCGNDVNIQRYCPEVCGACDVSRNPDKDYYRNPDKDYYRNPDKDSYRYPDEDSYRNPDKDSYNVRRQRYTQRPYVRRPSRTPRPYTRSDACRDIYPDWCSTNKDQCQTDRDMTTHCPCSCGVCT